MNSKIKPVRPAPAEDSASSFIQGGARQPEPVAPVPAKARKSVYNMTLWLDIMDRLQALADERRVSRSHLVGEALEQYLERESENAQ